MVEDSRGGQTIEPIPRDMGELPATLWVLVAGLLSTLLIPPFSPAAPALSPLRTQPVSVYHRDYSSPGSPIFFIYSWGFEDIIFLAL